VEEPIIYTIPISKQNKEYMQTMGVLIRKWEKDTNGTYKNITKDNFNKQIHTLHKKLKKEDCIYTEFSIEKDKHSNIYHTHLIIHYNDNEGNVQNRLSQFVGGDEWKERVIGLDIYNECNGRYGLIHTQPIQNIDLYRGYINKYGELKTLI
jgi:disulfide oxidoreductase YuzD